MKSITSYTAPATAALGLLSLTTLLGSYSIIGFSLATLAFFVAVIRHDYSARRPRWEPQHRGFTRFPQSHAAKPSLAGKLAA